MKYTIIILRPVWALEDNDPNTLQYVAYVEASTLRDAQVKACIEACNADIDNARETGEVFESSPLEYTVLGYTLDVGHYKPVYNQPRMSAHTRKESTT